MTNQLVALPKKREELDSYEMTPLAVKREALPTKM